MILTSRRQHRMLNAIHSSLRETDPRLVARFMTFTRMNRDEAIPAVERVRRRPLRWVPSLARAVARRWRRSRVRSAVLIPVAAMVTLVTVLLVLAGQSQASCTPASTGQDGGRVVAGRQYSAPAAACPASPAAVTGRGR